MKKILFYIPFIKIGGLEQVAIAYLKLLLQKGYKVALLIDFNLTESGNTFINEIPNHVPYQFVKSEKVSLFIYKFRTLGKKYKLFNIFLYGFVLLFDFLYYHFKVKKILAEGNYVCSISFYQFLPAYLTKQKNMKHIIWLHGSVEHFFNGIGKLFKNAYLQKLKKYNYIVTIAVEMQEQLMEMYPSLPSENIKMIYNPFDLEKIQSKSLEFINLSKEDKLLLEADYICTVSRIDENQKDIKTLIFAFAKLREEGKINEKLYIIGEGPSASELSELVASIGLKNNVLFLGKKNNPFIWMKHAKLFILSSKFEGFGMVLVEAMTVNTFVISSNCKTGPAEILKQGECGDLFEIGDTKKLASFINLALNDSLYRNNKIEKASERLKEFEKDKSIQQLIELIESSN
jgi:glycosyltransferase involved in cell wall biosynthesis